MNKKPISPNLQKPVDRVPTGQLPSALAELNEAALSETHTLPSIDFCPNCFCSYDGDEDGDDK